MLRNDEKLLVKLMEQYYGLLPSSVAKVLLYHGSITMKRALSCSILNRHDFEKGLNVLVRCDFVSVTTVNRQKFLEFDPMKIVNILYYPHYLLSISERFGVESVPLIKILFLYGQLTVNDLIERTLFHIIKQNSLEIVDEQMKFFIKSLGDKCKVLYEKSVIIPKFDPKQLKEEMTKVGIYNEKMIFTSLKKSLETSPESSFVLETSDSNKSSLLKLNQEALDYFYFMDLFPYLLNPPFENEEANFVFKMLLELNMEKSFKLNERTKLSYTKIYEQYQKQYPNISLSKLKTLLTIFTHYFAPNFIQVGKTGCSLNFDSFLTNLVKIIVKEFIKKNYGENSVRIFGALLEEVYIYEHNLLNSLKIDTKELHRILYVLNQNHIININFYSESNQSSLTSARNVKKTFSVNLLDVVDSIIRRCLYSIFTILHRRTIEMTGQRDLISRKNHIENYKKEIEEKVSDQEKKDNLIKTAHSFMSEQDHHRSERLLQYDCKVDKIEYHLVNYIFVLNLWKSLNNKFDDDQDFIDDNKIDDSF